ncbi:hypothetical protein PIB30_018502 [Stylosanthes scabra]|uniref:Uncharacterized protein n=1 Tax=Stylosanthes scabra TaxID=79078 RepID=A0ABU6X5F8_9FABA|nr:hypothetical protein [Stylosanthes scabra]
MENGATSKRGKLLKKYQGGKEDIQARATNHPKRRFSDIEEKQNRGNSADERNNLVVHNAANQSSKSAHYQKRSNSQLEIPLPSKVNGTSRGRQHEEQPNSNKLKSKTKCPAMTLDAFLHTEGVEVEREDDENFEPIAEDAGYIEKEPSKLTRLKNKSKHPAMSLDAFLGDEEIHVEGEEDHIEAPTAKDVRFEPTPNEGENDHIPMGKIMLMNMKIVILMVRETKLWKLPM